MKLTPEQREQIAKALEDTVRKGSFTAYLFLEHKNPEVLYDFAIRCAGILNRPKTAGTSPNTHFGYCIELLLSLDALVRSVDMDKVPSGHLLYGAYINVYKSMHYILSHFYVKTAEGYEK